MAPDRKNYVWYRPFIFEIIDAKIEKTGNIYTIVSKELSYKVDIHEDYLVSYHGTRAWRFEKFERFYDDYF